MTRRRQRGVPQGLKPISYTGLNGTAEAVPFPDRVVRQGQWRCNRERS
jgi:hypothetical protein